MWEIVEETEQKLTIRNYVVVNGAQSYSIAGRKSKITDDLKILVKLIEVKGEPALSHAITTNSNNQNAIKREILNLIIIYNSGLNWR